MRPLDPPIGFFALLACTAPALGQPAFLISQGSTLYRYVDGSVQTFLLSDGISGMTTVPAGVSVGNMNGGAGPGDAIAIGSAVYRVDDPLGTPRLTQIGNAGGVNASPVFVNGRLYGIGGLLPWGAVAVEWDPVTFAQIDLWPTGVFGGPGGMVSVAGTPDEFIYAEFNADRLWHYRLGDSNSTLAAVVSVDFDYVGMEMFYGTCYASFALPRTREFVFGTLDLGTGAFARLALLDQYGVGITGMTWVVPAPGTFAIAAVGALASARRRR